MERHNVLLRAGHESCRMIDWVGVIQDEGATTAYDVVARVVIDDGQLLTFGVKARSC